MLNKLILDLPILTIMHLTLQFELHLLSADNLPTQIGSKAYISYKFPFNLLTGFL